jgi:hypothetical protein
MALLSGPVAPLPDFREPLVNRAAVLAAALALCFCCGAPAHAFRCGDGNRYLAAEGMHKYQILNDCGEPEAREIVGVDKRYGGYRIVEEWLYVIEDTGNRQMYLIKFDREGRAVNIEWLGEQK